MLYRSRNFHSRFESSSAVYDSRDRDPSLAYMAKKGFQTPREVWLHNFRVFLQASPGPDPDWWEQARIDRQQKDMPNPVRHERDIWEQELMAEAYPEDAKMFVEHVNNYSLHICTPENEEDKFLLTQNAYGVFEGPISSWGWTSWHFFSPISPRLLVLLRHKEIGDYRDFPDWPNKAAESRINLDLAIQSDPTMVLSWLRDIPVHNSGRYSEEYLFPHFRIPTKHVQYINSMLLDNASSTQMIIYPDKRALARALEFFLPFEKRGLKVSLPADRDFDTDLILKASGEEIRKIISGQDRGYEAYLQGLERFATTELGSKAKLKQVLMEPSVQSLLPPMPACFAARYTKLGQ